MNIWNIYFELRTKKSVNWQKKGLPKHQDTVPRQTHWLIYLYSCSFIVCYKIVFKNNAKETDTKKKKTIGESGYWSRYLAHAKQALYHLS